MNEDSKLTLGKNIRAKREMLGLSQLELAQAVNKESAAYIAFIEAGERNVSAMDLLLIAKRLGTTASELLGESKSKSTDFVQALRSDKGVNRKDREKIEEFYEFLKSKNK